MKYNSKEKRNLEKRKPKRSKAEEKLSNQLETYGFPKPLTNSAITSQRKWTSDFLWRAKANDQDFNGLIVEIHASRLTFGDSKRNYEKSNWLTLNNWEVLHFTEEDVDLGIAAAYIFAMLDKLNLMDWTRKQKAYFAEWIEPDVELKRAIGYIVW